MMYNTKKKKKNKDTKKAGFCLLALIYFLL